MNNVMNTKYEDIKTSVQSEPNYLIITTEEIHEDDKRLEVKRINKHTGAYVSKVSATIKNEVNMSPLLRGVRMFLGILIVCGSVMMICGGNKVRLFGVKPDNLIVYGIILLLVAVSFMVLTFVRETVKINKVVVGIGSQVIHSIPVWSDMELNALYDTIINGEVPEYYIQNEKEESMAEESEIEEESEGESEEDEVTEENPEEDESKEED